MERPCLLNKENSFVLENALDREIVHAMTWLPIKMFTSSVMEGAMDCWCWAMIGRPELELLVRIFVVKKIFSMIDRLDR